MRTGELRCTRPFDGTKVWIRQRPFCKLLRRGVSDRFEARFEPERFPVRGVRLRNQRERRSSYLSDVSDDELESNAIRTQPRGAEMVTARRTGDETGNADEHAQRELTRSVGTPLVRQKKPDKKKLFGRRRERPTAES
jgi:hypothetical protein